MVYLEDDLYYDERLTFYQQTDEVQTYLNNIMNTSPDLIEKEWIDESQDIYREILLEWGHTTFKIKKEIIYRDPATSPSWGAIKDIIITIIEII